MRVTIISGIPFTSNDDPDFIPSVYFETAARHSAEWMRQRALNARCSAWSAGQPVSAYAERRLACKCGKLPKVVAVIV